MNQIVPLTPVRIARMEVIGPHVIQGIGARPAKTGVLTVGNTTVIVAKTLANTLPKYESSSLFHLRGCIPER